MVLLWLWPLALHAQFTYATINSTIAIAEYSGPGGLVTIPATIDGLPVTTIWSLVFAGNANLTGVILSDGLTSIGNHVFFGCSSLTNVMIPASLTNIGSAAFADCPTLAAILVDASNPAYSSVDGVLFDKNRTTLVACPGGMAGTYQIPDQPTRIDDYAFYGCHDLNGVIIPDTVTSIGAWAFVSCTGLTTLKIPDSVIEVGERAFVDCWRLASITIGNRVAAIDVETFAGCSSLTSIVIPNGVTRIEHTAFSFCTNLESVVIPESVTSIGQYAFTFCTSLKSAYFQGNPPTVDPPLSFESLGVTLYYLPRATGWDATYANQPTALWENPVVLEGTRRTVGQRLNFTIAWVPDAAVVVEATPTLTQPSWSPIWTSHCSGGVHEFSDPELTTSSPGRFYRVRSSSM